MFTIGIQLFLTKILALSFCYFGRGGRKGFQGGWAAILDFLFPMAAPPDIFAHKKKLG
jgi:hypothetical protein